MKKRQCPSVCRSIASSLALIQLASLAAAQQLPTPLPPPQTIPPPTELLLPRKTPSRVLVSYAEVVGAVNSNVLSREVYLQWRRDFPDGPSLHTTDTKAVGFWPTATTGLGSDMVCVGGLTIKGKTRIQVWQLDTNSALPAPQWDPVSATWTYPKTLIPIASKTTLYEANVAGRKNVRSLFPNQAIPSRVFVLFNSSRDLYELDTQSGGLVLILSASASPGVETEPGLLGDYEDWMFGDHTDHGYVYLFASLNPSPDGASWLLLQDANRDGVLDPGSSRLIGADEWSAMGFGDGAKWEVP